MINYPNGKKVVKVSSDQIAHKKANLGMQLEKDVILSCDYYRQMGRALIYKRPTPVKINKMDKNNRTHIIDAFFDSKSTTDFNGIYRGKYIDFECKETINKALSLSKIRPQQIEHLKGVLRLGGIAFFLVRFKSFDETYLLDAKYIVADLSKKTYNRTFFQEFGKLIKLGFQPRLEILDIVDEVYFNEEKVSSI